MGKHKEQQKKGIVEKEEEGNKPIFLDSLKIDPWIIAWKLLQNVFPSSISPPVIDCFYLFIYFRVGEQKAIISG